MRCASCGFENPERLKFCNECGTALKRRCAQCGFENAPQAKFCGECGTSPQGELSLQHFTAPGAKGKVQEEAEEHFLKAIEIARRQKAKLWELRAVTSLSRLWQHQGKRAEARQLLAKIYGWFTERFDTKDSQEAKALLTALA